LTRAPAARFDVVFLDPPFHQQLLQPAIDLLHQQGWLAPQALVYIEQALDDPPARLPATWQVRKLKAAGQVRYQLIEVGTSARATNETQ
jgi:16S rRNA (guanine966-N2)-methyltransferase